MANQIITIDNFPNSNIAERSTLTADASSAQDKVNIENANNFVADNYVVVGQLGVETTQLNQIESVSSLELTLVDNLSISHSKGEPIIRIRGNQAKIYRADNVDGTVPLDADFSVIATVDLEADQLYTEYLDATGGSGYWYKYTFYNSDTPSETSLADAIAVRGGDFGHYATIDEIRDEAGLNNSQYIKDSTIAIRRLQAEGEVKGVLKSAGYVLPLVDSAGASYTPPIIQSIVIQLCAGLLLVKEYGTNSPNTTKDGKSKMKSARDVLKQITAGTLLLLDETGTQLAFSTDIAGWPDDTTKDASFDGGRPEPKVFGMNKVY